MRRTRRSAARRARRRLLVRGGAAVALILLAIVGPWIAPYAPEDRDASRRLQSSSWNFWLGTDENGRDILSRTLHGARLTLGVGIWTALLAVAVGALLGVLAGFFGGITETFIMRLQDFLLSFPPLLMAIFLVAFVGSDMRNLVLILALLYVPRVARVIHPIVLAVKELEYVQSARAIGARPSRIIGHAILPNIWGAVLVQFSLTLAAAVIAEAGLSFLGLGPPPPAVSWGRQIRQSFSFMQLSPWPVLWPSIAVTSAVLVFGLLADAVRDRFDVRLRTSTRERSGQAAP